MEPKVGSLCTGTAAIDHAVQELIGGDLAWVADIKPAAEYILQYRYPDIPNLGDLKLIDWAQVEPVDVVVGSWPCQPHSPAGHRLGTEDPRDLWPWFLKAIKELRPKAFFGENVARICTNGELARVARSLAEIGYLVAWHTNTAESVGAPHKRQRTFVFASLEDANGELGDQWRIATPRQTEGGGHGPTLADEVEWLLPTPTESMSTGPGTSGREGGMNLQTAATLLPTPTAQSYGTNQGGAAGRTGQVRESLTTMANKGRDWGKYQPAIERWEVIRGVQAPEPTALNPKTGKSTLNPAFPEWMMGLRPGWVTDVPQLSKKSNGHRGASLSLIGDGVVPQQAVDSFRLLVDAVTREVST